MGGTSAAFSGGVVGVAGNDGAAADAGVAAAAAGGSDPCAVTGGPAKQPMLLTSLAKRIVVRRTGFVRKVIGVTARSANISHGSH